MRLQRSPSNNKTRRLSAMLIFHAGERPDRDRLNLSRHHIRQRTSSYSIVYIIFVYHLIHHIRHHTSSYFKTSVLARPQENGKPAAAFRKIHSGERFREPPFLVLQNAFYEWTELKAKTEGKKSPLLKKKDKYGRGLRCIKICCWWKRKKATITTGNDVLNVCCVLTQQIFCKPFCPRCSSFRLFAALLR